MKKKNFKNAIDQNDFIAYHDDEAYAKTDIPLHDTTGITCLTRRDIWGEYDPYAEPLDISQENNSYLFTVKKYGEGDLRVETKVFAPSFPSKRAVLIVQEHGRECQSEIITKLVEDGFTVVIPDYCANGIDTKTVFPSCVSYGMIGFSGEHFFKVMPTAKETCNYLYTLILRRTITFIEECLSLYHPVVIGIRNGVEYAMQVAGCDKRVRALGCICGAGYSEFLSHPLYAEPTLTIDAERLAWLTGVSGVSYLIDRPIPLFVGIGSNDLQSDMDRVPNLSNFVGSDNLTACICNGYSDNVTAKCFDTLLKWLRLTFLDASFPARPTVRIKLNADGTVYADISADACTPIATVSLYYAFNDVNHQTRNWNVAVCETVGKGEFLAHIPIWEEDSVLFCYANVYYENGVTLSGFLVREDLSDKRVFLSQQDSENVLYSFGSDNSSFTEYNEEPVLFSDSISEYALPIGLKGVYTAQGRMILFIGDITKSIDKTRGLQVDCYSEEKNFKFTLCLTDGFGRNYYATKTAFTDAAFENALFSCYDFKDDRFHPLPSWADAKRLTVCTKNIVIGKLLFV